MSKQEPEDLEKLMREVLAELHAVRQHQETASKQFTDFLQEAQTRRSCEFSFEKIRDYVNCLKLIVPRGEGSFTDILQRLDWYVHLSFKSLEDLRALQYYLSLIVGILEGLERDGTTIENYWERLKPVYELLDELQTLDEGDPPGQRSNAQKSIRDLSLNDQLRNEDRKLIRERAEERVRESIRQRFR
jgi:hypothetical protein